MTNLKLMKAQCKLALTRVEPRLEVSIVSYMTALEKEVEADAAAIKRAQELLRATQRNWDEQCLFDCDDILTKVLK